MTRTRTIPSIKAYPVSHEGGKVLKWPVLDPDEVDTRGIDYSPRLHTDAAIVTREWTIETGDGQLSIDSEQVTGDGKIAQVTLSGGTPGVVYEILSQVEEAAQGGVLLQQRVKLKVKSK